MELLFNEDNVETLEQHELHSLIMSEADDNAEKLTELECKVIGIKCYNVEMDGETEVKSYTDEAEEIFFIYYGEQITSLYKLFNAQLKTVKIRI